eukprot:3165876-Pleurochrysis_carterae.AAC.1
MGAAEARWGALSSGEEEAEEEAEVGVEAGVEAGVEMGVEAGEEGAFRARVVEGEVGASRGCAVMARRAPRRANQEAATATAMNVDHREVVRRLLAAQIRFKQAKRMVVGAYARLHACCALAAHRAAAAARIAEVAAALPVSAPPSPQDGTLGGYVDGAGAQVGTGGPKSGLARGGAGAGGGGAGSGCTGSSDRSGSEYGVSGVNGVSGDGVDRYPGSGDGVGVSEAGHSGRAALWRLRVALHWQLGGGADAQVQALMLEAQL